MVAAGHNLNLRLLCTWNGRSPFVSCSQSASFKESRKQRSRCVSEMPGSRFCRHSWHEMCPVSCRGLFVILTIYLHTCIGIAISSSSKRSPSKHWKRSFFTLHSFICLTLNQSVDGWMAATQCARTGCIVLHYSLVNNNLSNLYIYLYGQSELWRNMLC